VGGCSFCKDLKNELELIDNRASAGFRDIEELGCGEPVIENCFLCTRTPDKFGKFLDFPST
jgi:hypothetical protein